MHPRQEAHALPAGVYGRGMRRVLVVAVMLMLVVSTGVALAAGPTIRVSPATVLQGYQVRVYGVVPGCAVGNRVTLLSRAFSHRNEFAGVPAIFAEVKTGHKYSRRTTIPARRRPGRYSVTGRCGGGNLGVTAHLRVIVY